MLLFNKIVYKHSQWITSKSGKYYCAESSWLIQNSQEEMWPKMYTIKKIAKYFFYQRHGILQTVLSNTYCIVYLLVNMTSR